MRSPVDIIVYVCLLILHDSASSAALGVVGVAVGLVPMLETLPVD